MKKVTKEQTLHGFEGFNAVSNEELEKVDGGKGFSLIKSGVSFSSGAWDIAITADVNGRQSSTWHDTPQISSGNGSLVSIDYGPVHGSIDSVRIGVTFNY